MTRHSPLPNCRKIYLSQVLQNGNAFVSIKVTLWSSDLGAVQASGHPYYSRTSLTL